LHPGCERLASGESKLDAHAPLKGERETYHYCAASVPHTGTPSSHVFVPSTRSRRSIHSPFLSKMRGQSLYLESGATGGCLGGDSERKCHVR
jgi:hypothetical protein